MIDYIKFGNVDSRNYGLKIFPLNIDGGPVIEYENMPIPGRSGDLLIPNKRMSNIEHSYTAVIFENTETNLMNFRNALSQYRGYCRLEDSLHNNEYYMAVYKGGIDPIITIERGMAKMEVIFERKPQRYLKSGEATIDYTESGTITNPTSFESQPLIRVYGTGILGIGNRSISINNADVYTDIDCLIMEAYKGTVSCNPNIHIDGVDYPVLTPGNNGITLGSGITKVSITPRWWIV